MRVLETAEKSVSAFFRLVCDFEVLTPMFLGGADSTRVTDPKTSVDPRTVADPKTAELRAPSVKGAMRFWYRAFDPRFKEHEPVHFGSGGQNAGQSRLIVRCRAGERAQERMTWSEINKGSGPQTTNGLVYLGYPFGMKGNERRTAIPPGARFTVEVSCHRSAPEELVRGATTLRVALASMWSLGHFGALGSRARRGFGAVALTGWRVEDRDGAASPGIADLERLPMLHGRSSASDWRAGALEGIGTLRSWFGTFEQKASRPHHPCFGPKADLVVWSKHPRRDWHGILRALGAELQSARQRTPPDYALVKDHVRFKAGDGGRHIEQVPDRATFGLPLTFRYRSLPPRGQPVMFSPTNGERHGSLLFLRPVVVGGALFGLFLRLDGDVPGIDTQVGVRSPGRSSQPLKSAAHNAMDAFMRDMKGKAGQ